jgi:hypothetical protein
VNTATCKTTHTQVRTSTLESALRINQGLIDEHSQGRLAAHGVTTSLKRQSGGHSMAGLALLPTLIGSREARTGSLCLANRYDKPFKLITLAQL